MNYNEFVEEMIQEFGDIDASDVQAAHAACTAGMDKPYVAIAEIRSELAKRAQDNRIREEYGVDESFTEWFDCNSHESALGEQLEDFFEDRIPD